MINRFSCENLLFNVKFLTNMRMIDIINLLDKYFIGDEKEEYLSFALSERPRLVQAVRQGERRSLLS